MWKPTGAPSPNVSFDVLADFHARLLSLRLRRFVFRSFRQIFIAAQYGGALSRQTAYTVDGRNVAS